MSAPLILQGHETALATGLQVRRLLPAAARRAVGPFVFFDHFGPVTLPAGVDSDVGGHPHIGLATVTYLFDGRQVHRDSLGTVQPIEPGAVNWMTAGRGIVHSERTHDDDRGRDRPAHGLQLWVALPPGLSDVTPSFQHAGAEEIPEIDEPGGVQLRLLVGEAFGQRSPVKTASPTLYLDITLPPHTRWDLPALAPELALYAPCDELQVNGLPLPAAHMAVLPDGEGAQLASGATGARLVVVGGEALPQPVRMWWNFVGYSREVLGEAAARWAADGFDPIPGETDRIDGPPWRG